MSKNPYPYVITIDTTKGRFKELLAWLRDQNHVLRTTMIFGTNTQRRGSDLVTQTVKFRDKNAAMMFKLAWGGQ